MLPCFLAAQARTKCRPPFFAAAFLFQISVISGFCDMLECSAEART